MGGVAVIAGGHIVMGAALPALVLLVHGMAVRAGRRIVTEIARDLRVVHREAPDAQDHSQQRRQPDPAPPREGVREIRPQRDDAAFHGSSPPRVRVVPGIAVDPGV